jgi:uncharacterized membrane protein YvbJ
MALINCPECGRSVSEQALTCPNCGHPIKARGLLRRGQRPSRPSSPMFHAKEPPARSSVSAGFGGCLGVLFAIIFVITALIAFGVTLSNCAGS